MKSEKEIKQKSEEIEEIMMDVGLVDQEKLHSFRSGISQALAWVLEDERHFSLRGKDDFFKD